MVLYPNTYCSTFKETGNPLVVEREKQFPTTAKTWVNLVVQSLSHATAPSNTTTASARGEALTYNFFVAALAAPTG